MEGADLKLGAQQALLGIGLQPLVWGTRNAWVTVTQKHIPKVRFIQDSKKREQLTVTNLT